MISIGDIADIPPPTDEPKYPVGAMINTMFNDGVCRAQITAITNRIGEYTYDVILLTDCVGRTGVIPAGTRTWVYLDQIVRLS